MRRLRWMIALSIVALFSNTALAEKEFCPKVYHKGVIELDINPAFLHMDQYDTENGGKTDGLTVSSFFNTTFSFNPWAGIYVPNFPPFAADQVGLIMDIGDLEPALFDFATDFEVLTDAYSPPWAPQTTWPNQAARIPDGVLDFEAVIVPQGFHPIPTAGRLTFIRLDTLQEYIVHEGTLNRDEDIGSPENTPRFYHEAIFYDMDGDGDKDIVTARSGFKLLTDTQPPTVYPPFSELLYFKNPGADLDPGTAWEEVILYGGFMADPAFMGPDIHLAMYDFEGDNIPEIVATHFFTGDDPLLPQPTKGKIAIYGAPLGRGWKDVNAYLPWAQPRVNVINETQGFPFAIEIVDLNGDGKVEVLATNHQLNCMPFPGHPGQVYALEQPASGDIFGEAWTVRVLLDGILPQPTPAGATGMRMAPGHAITFYPKEKHEKRNKRPWILVSGDEAGKVWIMKPTGHDFDYKTAVIFDINDYYGENTTQSFTPEGTTISTIGRPALRYEQADKKNCHNKGK